MLDANCPTTCVNCGHAGADETYDDYCSQCAVWHNPISIANILTLTIVKQLYRVSYNSLNGGCFRVHEDDGIICAFLASPSDLFYTETTTKAPGSGASAHPSPESLLTSGLIAKVRRAIQTCHHAWYCRTHPKSWSVGQHVSKLRSTMCTACGFIFTGCQS